MKLTYRLKRPGISKETLRKDREANIFAYELLMPAEWFEMEYDKLQRDPNLSDDQIVEALSHIFRVELERVVARALQLGLAA